ncbi:MAG: FtsQ-type POTRA domain-containing protein [Chloroflexota bacterium]|nr:FtsQ-type POTRA domain-containing protein [Chloroflexota bacterium]
MTQKESFVVSMAKHQSNEMSRAQKLRTRRKQTHSKSEKPTYVVNATRKRSKHTPPVTRRRTPATPVINRKRNKIHVPLKAKGAELQLPAFPQLNLSWRLISGAVFILSLAVVIFFSSLSAFEVSTINLKGSKRLTTDAILSQLNIVGLPIIEVEPEQLAIQLTQNFPSLTSVSISTGLPASVTIRVEEREPLILWQQDNSSLWIDIEGVMFPIRGEAEVAFSVVANSDPPPAPTKEGDSLIENEDEPTLPMVEEPTFPRTTPKFIRGLLSISDYVPEDSYLQYDPQFGLGWQDSNGWLAYFGKDMTNIDIKLAEYQTIIAEMKRENITPALISLEFLHAPFYRLE